jgi:hypothetical protein
VDNEIFSPAGELAGELPDRGLSVILQDAKGKSYSPAISRNAYYFDGVPSGQYTLRVNKNNKSIGSVLPLVIPWNWVLVRRDL